MAKIVYQLVAKGRLRGGMGGHRFHSKKVFTNQEEAEDFKDDFLKLVTEPFDAFVVLDTERPIDIHIVELDLVEEV